MERRRSGKKESILETAKCSMDELRLRHFHSEGDLIKAYRFVPFRARFT